MKFKKKKLFVDLLILIIPVVIIILLIPILPDQITIHRGINNRTIDKHFAFILGFLPYAIYKIKYDKK